MIPITKLLITIVIGISSGVAHAQWDTLLRAIVPEVVKQTAPKAVEGEDQKGAVPLDANSLESSCECPPVNKALASSIVPSDREEFKRQLMASIKCKQAGAPPGCARKIYQLTETEKQDSFKQLFDPEVVRISLTERSKVVNSTEQEFIKLFRSAIIDMGFSTFRFYDDRKMGEAEGTDYRLSFILQKQGGSKTIVKILLTKTSMPSTPVGSSDYQNFWRIFSSSSFFSKLEVNPVSLN